MVKGWFKGQLSRPSNAVPATGPVSPKSTKALARTYYSAASMGARSTCHPLREQPSQPRGTRTTSPGPTSMSPDSQPDRLGCSEDADGQEVTCSLEWPAGRAERPGPVRRSTTMNPPAAPSLTPARSRPGSGPVIRPGTLRARHGRESHNCGFVCGRRDQCDVQLGPPPLPISPSHCHGESESAVA